MNLPRLPAGLLATLAMSTFAAGATPPPAEVFFSRPDILEAVLSPSGRKLAITSAKGVARVGLAVMDLGPGNRITRVAQYADGDISGVQWVNEDRLIFGMADFVERTGKPMGWPGLFAIDADGSHYQQLIRRVAKPSLTNGTPSRVLDWNHRLVHVPAPVAGQANEEILIAQFSPDEDRVATPLWLNVRTGLTHSVRGPLPSNVVAWQADSRGEPWLAIARTQGRQAAYWRAPGSAHWTQLYESDLLSSPFDVVGADDAGHLYVTRSSGPAGYRWLTRYEFRTGKPQDRFVVETPGFDFQGIVLSKAGSGKAMGVRMTVDGETTIWFDPVMKSLQERADQLFPGRINRINCRRCGAADMVALVRSFSDHDPGRLYLYQAKPPEGEKPWSAIAPLRADAKPEQMAGLALHRIKARDGQDLPVWVTRPDGAAGPLPAVVLVHGGPWLRGGAWGWHAEPQFLASRGYVVIEPEMRGSTGYGDAHFEAGFKQWGRAMQDDVADALRWAQAQGLATDKACIAGDSYGGYSTLMGLANDPGLYRCGIAGFAVTDLELFVRGSLWTSDDIGSTTRRYALPELVGDWEKDAAMLAAQSPVKVAARIKAPVMLVAGEEDRRVPLVHAERMRNALHEAGNDPVWVIYPGEAHGLGELKNRVDYAQRMEAFLAKYLQPAQP